MNLINLKKTVFIVSSAFLKRKFKFPSIFQQLFTCILQVIGQKQIIFTVFFPLCLHLKYEGLSRGKGRAQRIKWSCPKTRFVKRKLVCFCNNKCSDSESGRMFYTYPVENYRMYSGLARDTEEWFSLYKMRATAEKQ